MNWVKSKLNDRDAKKKQKVSVRFLWLL